MDADNAGPTLLVLGFQGLSLSGSALKGEGDPGPPMCPTVIPLEEPRDSRGTAGQISDSD